MDPLVKQTSYKVMCSRCKAKKLNINCTIPPGHANWVCKECLPYLEKKTEKKKSVPPTPQDDWESVPSLKRTDSSRLQRTPLPAK